MSEQWKDIPGYDGKYRVSNLGRVLSLKTNKLLKHGKIPYHIVQLSNGALHQKSMFVHRLVAEAFIPNPLNLPHVNHIDADKDNNTESNLEWCTARYNMLHHHNRRKLKGEKSDDE